MNICVECKFIKKNPFCETKFHECQHPDCRHPVSGRALTCVELRKPKGVCGVEGKLYEVDKLAAVMSHVALALPKDVCAIANEALKGQT